MTRMLLSDIKNSGLEAQSFKIYVAIAIIGSLSYHINYTKSNQLGESYENFIRQNTISQNAS